MNIALKLIQMLIPILIEIIKDNHPSRSDEDHLNMTHDLIKNHIDSLKK